MKLKEIIEKWEKEVLEMQDKFNTSKIIKSANGMSYYRGCIEKLRDVINDLKKLNEATESEVRDCECSKPHQCTDDDGYCWCFLCGKPIAIGNER